MIENESTGNGFYMPVAPAYNGNAGGFGDFGGGGWWILLLFILLGNGNWGMANGGMMGGYGLYPWMNQAEITTNGFQNSMLNDGLTSVRDGISGLSTQLCNGFAGVNASVANGFAQAEIANNARQIADMQATFGLQSALQNCCCENRLGIANLGADIAREACATRTSDTQNTQAILTAVSGGIQSIKDQLCSDKIESKNDTIAQLRQELMFARGQASQDVQTAAIQAGQRALANEVEQYVLPTPRPAYIVQNPNCCQPAGCGCGSF